MKSLREQLMTTSKVLVFDIKRFAVHDGAGIRTTVFLKGCPLRCKWCQNPEGLRAHREPVYFPNRCLHCRNCEKYGEGLLRYDQKPIFLQNTDLEDVFRHCPANAIQYDSEVYSLNQLIDQVLKDKVFFQYGGGVTLSGGEPFMQGQALIELLQALHQEIHTAIETSLYTSTDLVKQAAPYLDQIYCDMKIYDEDEHIQATGVSNRLIKKNIEYLLTSQHKKKVIIRTPLIPGFTAKDQNIKEISQYLSQLYPDVKYELLNYNPLAQAKYDMTPFEYGVEKNLPLYNQEQLNHYYQILKDNGIKNIIKGE